jgi:hypothetical protein
MSDLATLADLETWLGLAVGNDDEPLLTRLIGAASAAAQSWCGQNFASATVTETRDGTGGRRLAFGQTPVTSVQSVTIDGITIPPSPAPGQPGYLWSATSLSLVGYSFGWSLGGVVIAYTAGYATVPADLAQAVLEWAGEIYRAKDRIGMSAETLGGQATPFLVAQMPPRVGQLLAPYRRVVPV